MPDEKPLASVDEKDLAALQLHMVLSLNFTKTQLAAIFSAALGGAAWLVKAFWPH